MKENHMTTKDTKHRSPSLAELLRGGKYSFSELCHLSCKSRPEVARYLARARERRLFSEKWHPRGFMVYSAHLPAKSRGMPRAVQLALVFGAMCVGACEVAEPAFACEHGDTLVHSAHAGEIVAAWKCDELGRWSR